MAVTVGTVRAPGPTRSLDVRTAELDALLRHAADAGAGAARAVLVRGRPGSAGATCWPSRANDWPPRA